jgi:hypothetical protein
MADQIIVATFNNSNDAYDAATAVKALKDKGIVDFKAKAGVMGQEGRPRQPFVAGEEGAAALGNGRRNNGRRLDRAPCRFSKPMDPGVTTFSKPFPL